MPREGLLGKRDASDVMGALRLRILDILSENDPASHFSLNPSPTAPRNAFLPLRLLQDKLGLQGRVNALLVGGGPDDLQEDLQRHLTLDDWGLELHSPRSRTAASAHSS